MTRKIVEGVKDEKGAFVPIPKVKPEELSLDYILERQLRALDQVTTQLLGMSKGMMTKDEIQSLATCIKITLELKARENELLEALSDEDLEKLAQK